MPHAKIATHQAVHTLNQLHAELAGKILDNKRESDRLREAMVHVEAVIKMLAPAADIRRIAVRRRKLNPWFKRGTIWRAVLDVLRTASAPKTAAEITTAMLAAKGVQDRFSKATRDLEGAVRATLRNHEGAQIIEIKGEGPRRWELASSR